MKQKQNHLYLCALTIACENRFIPAAGNT